MARTVEGVGHAAVCAGKLDRQLRVRAERSCRAKTQRRQEDRKGVHKRNLADRGKTCRHADHVGLRDADVQKPLGARFSENTRLRRAAEVCVKHHGPLVVLAVFDQCLAVYFTDCLSHYCAPPSSFIACAKLSSSIALPCQPLLPSMNETPFPLTVCARIMVG